MTLRSAAVAALVLLATGCAPDAANNRAATGFNGFVDHRTISPAQYRESLGAFFGAGNDGTIACIVGNLPPAP